MSGVSGWGPRAWEPGPIQSTAVACEEECELLPVEGAYMTATLRHWPPSAAGFDRAQTTNAVRLHSLFVGQKIELGPAAISRFH